MKRTSNYRQIITYHERFGHMYVPNQYARMRYGDDAYFLETDQHGFRNSKQKPSGKTKVLILGDSYAAGDGVKNEDRFGDLLANILDVEVINLAVNGYGMDQQLLVYENYKDQIEHDAILWVPHMDDLYRNLKDARIGVNREGQSIKIPKPYFKLINDQLSLENVPVPRSSEVVSGEKETQNGSLPKAFNELKNKAKHLINRTAGRHLVGKISYPELNEGVSDEWLLADKIIDKMISLVGDKTLVLAPIPYNYVVATEEPQFYESFFQKFESETIHYLDLMKPLQREFNRDPNDFYLPLCGHFSHRAHRYVVEVLQPALREWVGIALRSDTKISKTKPSGYVLGVSCFYHDSAAALIKDGEIIAAAQEERFSRVKHDKRFPINAIHYCLEEAKIHINALETVCYYDNPGLTLERVIHNAASLATEKVKAFWQQAGPSMFNKLRIRELLHQHFNYQKSVHHTLHHISHAASAFYPSPFDSAAILVIDGVGEWSCSTIAHGQSNTIKNLMEQRYPHSLGLLYSAFTYFCGFKVNSGEYKLMGLAPYGKPTYADKIKESVVNIHDDGSIALNMSLFGFMEGEAMTNENFDELFGGPRRESESRITQREMDLAASIQAVTEEIVLKMARHAKEITGEENLVLAGGVALNCVANGILLRENIFKDIWIQPAAGDAGGALGAALEYYYQKCNPPSEQRNKSLQTHAYLGPSFSENEVMAFLETQNVKSHVFDKDKREDQLAEWIDQQKIIGYFDGRMEFGPRALAHRSIIGSPTDAEMQRKFNLKIKYRESFRPFAPIALEESLSDYFDIDRPSPFMLLVAPVNEKLRTHVSTIDHGEDMISMVNEKRSVLPSITHVDYSARLQSMNGTDNMNPGFHRLLKKTKAKSGYGVLINTSFNVRGEPIVCTPQDAYICFMRTEMDVLVLGNQYLLKSEQPKWSEEENWQESFELD